MFIQHAKEESYKALGVVIIIELDETSRII
jgi:hypothetical protein